MEKIKRIITENIFLIVMLFIIFIALLIISSPKEIDIQKEKEELNLQISNSEEFKESRKYISSIKNKKNFEKTEDTYNVRLLTPKLTFDSKDNLQVKLVNFTDIDILDYKFVFLLGEGKSYKEISYNEKLESGDIAIFNANMNAKVDIRDIIPIFNIVTVKENGKEIIYIYDYELKEIFKYDK